ncbi:Holliday junction branch migration protein RuvA [Granulicoccus phenolivorans]|uniref:Holliday junction branch migration protein RuvA n=1 Tax=Granulicoccus phenolivorans TaxID=266854 RepID=UPI0004239157|nr:Holliday junction branch migration protein RuvA [Granulicoccus phenolivorans]
MITHLHGTVCAAGATWVDLDLQGLGFRVLCTPATAAGVRLGEATHLQTHLVVREDSQTLYGFATSEERDCFELCLGASGVGPKLALAIMSVLSPGELAATVEAGDHKTLTRVPGIGPKGAQRIVLELKGKVIGFAGTGPAAVAAPVSEPWREQVSTGLQGLGWSTKDAEAACDRVAPLAETEDNVAVLMRAALQTLAK